jgi:hypothetical protein
MSSELLASVVFFFFWEGCFQLSYPQPLARFFFSIWQSRAGTIRDAFSGYHHQTIKKVPKKGNTQQCRTRRVRIYFFYTRCWRFRSDVLSLVCLLVMFSLFMLHDIVHDLLRFPQPRDGLMSLSFWVRGWDMSHDELGGRMDWMGRAGICVRIYQIACLHADDDGHFEDTNTDNTKSPA